MVFAEEIKRTILRLAEERGPERSFALSDVAQAIDQKNWNELTEQIRLVATILIREGKIIGRKTDESVPAEFSKPPDHDKGVST